jgi:hypothetical protein
MVSPRQIAEEYSNAVSNIADNAISATRLANNMISANLQTFNTSVQTAKENVKEFSKMSGNTIKTFQQYQNILIDTSLQPDITIDSK